MVFRRLIAAVTAACFLSIGFQTASAGVIGTQAYLAGADRAGSDRADPVGAVAPGRAETSSCRLGVDPAAAQRARRQPVRPGTGPRLAASWTQLPAGGDGLLAVIGIVFIVLLILELTGVMDIFKKI